MNRVISNIKTNRDPILIVFIVEDELLFLHALGCYLKRIPNARVHCYKSGEECLKNMSIKPNIVILDYYLNDGKAGCLNGIETLKEIKKLSPNSVVIMLSGQESLDIVLNTLRAEAFTYIPKNNLAFSAVQKTIAYIQTNNKKPTPWIQKIK